MFSLNSRLRVASDAFAITDKNSEVAKDLIKVIAKELEESNILVVLTEEWKFVAGAAMVYSYLDPV